MKRLFPFLFSLFLFAAAVAQDKKSLTIDDLVKWNRVTEKVISDNGSISAFVISPWDGDPSAELYNKQGEKLAAFSYASDITFTSDSHYLIFTINQSQEKIKELKLKKTKKEDLPLNKLGIYDTGKKTSDTVDRIKSFKVPEKWSGWLAYQCEPLKTAARQPSENNPGKEKGAGDQENAKKSKTESSDNGYHLFIKNLQEGSIDTVKFVTDYLFAKEVPFLICATTGDEKSVEPGVILINLTKNSRAYIKTGKGKYRQLTISDKGDKAAFVYSGDEKDKTGNSFELYCINDRGTAEKVAGRGSAGIPEGWIINENARLIFGEKTGRLYFGTSPAYKLKDSTILDEDRPDVDVWHYAEGTLHTVQVINKPRDLKKSYTAVWHGDIRKVVQLGTPDKPDIQLINKGDAPVVLALSDLPYELESMWEGGPDRYDTWLIDVISGQTQKIKENYRARIRPSPAGKYLFWYYPADSSWYSWDIMEKREFKLTNPFSLPCYDELNDVPDLPGSYPAAGWLKDDAAFLIADRYDIWSLDPHSAKAPVNITVNGRKNRVSYSLIDFDRDKDFIDPSEKQYFVGVNEVTRENGYYSSDLKKKSEPLLLTGGKFRLGTPVKAKNEPIIIYTKETFEMFPDYLISDLSFKASRRLTDANPQQKEYLWGSAEVVKWLSLDGLEIEGLLYKPEGFDPSKKYPMIVNFYEKSSSELYTHRIPEAGRSTIDYHYYTGNGYLVFNPDVYYSDGYPGQSAYNCVMPGIMSLVQKGFVDEKHIGAQGHSWGGYQVAYLATRTGLFAAIESGAPVVDMYSAYGGIRWETGLNRSMQYEHQQSRIGASIWEAPDLYWENSPLFSLEKVTTPLLIMANDHDGHVPWWQGIEYFIGLRRLGKPAWLLNYNGEPHWPLKQPNKVDFQKRMSQFFAHYLKNEPEPQWMKEGIPATEKDFTLGY